MFVQGLDQRSLLECVNDADPEIVRKEMSGDPGKDNGCAPYVSLRSVWPNELKAYAAILAIDSICG
jgi:hypothetical protein